VTEVYVDVAAASMEQGGEHSGGVLVAEPEAVRALRYLADSGVRVVIVAADGSRPDAELAGVAAEVVSAVPPSPEARRGISPARSSAAADRPRTCARSSSARRHRAARCGAATRSPATSRPPRWRFWRRWRCHRAPIQAASEPLPKASLKRTPCASRGSTSGRQRTAFVDLLRGCNVRRCRSLRDREGRAATIAPTRRSLVATFPPLGTRSARPDSRPPPTVRPPGRSRPPTEDNRNGARSGAVFSLSGRPDGDSPAQRRASPVFVGASARGARAAAAAGAAVRQG